MSATLRQEETRRGTLRLEKYAPDNFAVERFIADDPKPAWSPECRRKTLRAAKSYFNLCLLAWS